MVGEQRTQLVSELDGAVDDLFSTSSIPLIGGASIPGGVGNVTFCSAPVDKDELVFDSEGNMVLQAVTAVASHGERISGEATTTVDSATCGYDFAYRKPKPTKWSFDETVRFYQALELYGSDQMLINTMLPTFTAVQIRQKFKAEMRKDAARFNRCLYAKRRMKLCCAKYEELHGAISNPVSALGDTSTPDCEEAQIAVSGHSDILDSLFDM